MNPQFTLLMRSSGILLLFAVARLVESQQIQDVWQTTFDQKNQFKKQSIKAINFVTPGPIGQADIVVDDSTVHQSILGFGGSLTDSSATILSNLKSKNSGNYAKVLSAMFSPTDDGPGAGLNYIRVPIGASDFSAKDYSLDDTKDDTSFSKFNFNAVPSNVISVLKDIMSQNPYLRVHLCPWSPPGWMKDGGTMNGGSLKTQLIDNYATYLLKAVQGWKGKGFPVHAISIQNEPQNNDNTYPSCEMPPDVEGKIGAALKALLNKNGLSSVDIIGYEHNWNDAQEYPVQLFKDNGAAFSGVAFHCYAGSVSAQSAPSTAPNTDIYFTECSGTFGSDWWSDVKYYMDSLWIGALEHNSRTGLMWNIALDGKGNPKLPGTNSCGGPGCSALVTVNSDGTYQFNEEFISMAQASKAIIPKDVGGPFGQRMGVSVKGSLAGGLRVGAYVTDRNNAKDFSRYSLVVMNWNDGGAANFNPKSIKATIEFRGKQATFDFPVGVTTLWWFATKNLNTHKAIDGSGGNSTDTPVRRTVGEASRLQNRKNHHRKKRIF